MRREDIPRWKILKCLSAMEAHFLSSVLENDSYHLYEHSGVPVAIIRWLFPTRVTVTRVTFVHWTRLELLLWFTGGGSAYSCSCCRLNRPE